MLVFEDRGKPEYPEKNLSEQRRAPTNSAHIWRRVRESYPGHIGGRPALSPLRQPCSPTVAYSTILHPIPYQRALYWSCWPLYFLWPISINVLEFYCEWRSPCSVVVCEMMWSCIFSSFHSSRENELNKLTSLPMCGFISQLVEHRTGIAEVTGSNPIEALIFSGFFFPIA